MSAACVATRAERSSWSRAFEPIEVSDITDAEAAAFLRRRAVDEKSIPPVVQVGLCRFCCRSMLSHARMLARAAFQLMKGPAHWDFVTEGNCPSADEGGGSLGICRRGNTALRHLNSGRGRAAGAAGEMRHHAVQGHRPARCATPGRSVLQGLGFRVARVPQCRVRL